MKFDCGETYQEWEARVTKWHDFFPLWPRRVGSHDCRWLEVIERRGFSLWGEWMWEYRAKVRDNDDDWEQRHYD